MLGFRNYEKSDILTNLHERISAVNVSLLYPHLPAEELAGDAFDKFLKERFSDNHLSRSQYHMAVQSMLDVHPPAELADFPTREICAWMGDGYYPSTVIVRVPHELYGDSGMHRFFTVNVSMSRSGVGFKKVTPNESITDKVSDELKKKSDLILDPRPLLAKVKSTVQSSLNEKGLSSQSVNVSDVVHQQGYKNIAAIDIMQRVKDGSVPKAISEQILKHLESNRVIHRVGYSTKALAAFETFTGIVNDKPVGCMITAKAMYNAVDEVRSRLPIPVSRDHGGKLKDIIGAVHAIEYDKSSGFVALPVVELHKNDASMDICEVLDKGVNVQVSVIGGGIGEFKVFEKRLGGGIVRTSSLIAGHGQLRIKEYDRFKIEGFDLVLKGAVQGVNFQIL